MMQLIFKKSANTFHQLLSSRFFTLSHQSPIKTIQSVSPYNKCPIEQVPVSTKIILLLHEYCKTNHNNSKHTTNYSPPKYPCNTNLISNSLFLNEIKNANKKKQPYNLLNTIKHQFKYIHFFYQQILLMLKSVSDLKTIKRNTT